MDTVVKFLVIAAVVVTVAFAVIREGLNYLEHPSLQIVRYPADGRDIVLYHRGAARRTATLFVRDIEGRSDPDRVAVVHYGEEATATPPEGEGGGGGIPPAEARPIGELVWTADGTALVAVARASHRDEQPPPLWLYDVGSRTMFAAGLVRSGQPMTAQHLDVLLRVKGGLGHHILHWYEMGKKENYVFSWKAHHWNRLSRADREGDG